MTDERNRFGYENKRTYGLSLHWTPDEEAEGERLTKQFMECAQRVVKREPGRPPASEERVLKPMARFRDELCACSDRRCLDRVRAETAKYYDSVTHVPLDDAEDARLIRIESEASACGSRPLAP